jgi:hypothetical protein
LVPFAPEYRATTPMVPLYAARIEDLGPGDFVRSARRADAMR